MKRILIMTLAAVMILSMAGLASAGVYTGFYLGTYGTRLC